MTNEELIKQARAMARGLPAIATGERRVLNDLADALETAVAEEREALSHRLNAKADQYAKDGEPGELGYNCWGWRDIERILREEAAAIRARGRG